MSEFILNLCSGNNPIKGALNVDVCEPADWVVDISKTPWIWSDESVDGIYMIHGLEHFPDQVKIINECYRILKKGGFLHLVVPHSSSAMSIGCMGHYRTYSYDTLRDYLSRPFYLFKTKRFDTVYQKLSWWYDRPVTNVPFWMKCFIVPFNTIINLLANLSPRVCENLWCFWCGGFKEVHWKGVKV